MPWATRRWRASMITGAASKSMSATHMGSTSRPAYFCHFCESVPRRSDGLSKLKVMRGPSEPQRPPDSNVFCPGARRRSGALEQGDEPHPGDRDQSLVGDPDL